ncbi:hypothetical protein B0H19DRAFT_1060166 [Mycena capillaripes]|nr:hypothetical protein B0H19DRAFT_1060166 [Mycena capillaripes]
MHTVLLALFCVATAVLAVQRNITVDDTDLAISYTGSGWHTDTEPTAMNGSVHTTCNTSSTDARATFNFTGVAIYYLPPPIITCSPMTTLILDDGAPISFNVTGPDGTKPRIWGATNLSNGPHTIVNAGLNSDVARIDAFTVDTNIGPPQTPTGSKNVFVSADTFTYSGNWTNSTDQVPSCVESGHVAQTSTDNSTFSFNFTGEALYLNTLASSTGGRLSISINGGEPEFFDTWGPDDDSCALLSLNVTSLVKRSLASRDDTDTDTQNAWVTKSPGGPPNSNVKIGGAYVTVPSSGRSVCASIAAVTATAAAVALTSFF